MLVQSMRIKKMEQFGRCALDAPMVLNRKQRSHASLHYWGMGTTFLQLLKVAEQVILHSITRS